jgi:hypothetical protein
MRDRILRRTIWLIWKNSYFFRLGVNQKKALIPSLSELETSRYGFWRFIFAFLGHIFESRLAGQRVAPPLKIKV